MSAASSPHGSSRSGSIRRHTLPNGLSILIEPLRHAPVVALQAWVHVGAADEDKAHDAGLAHLHEHMLFKGTERRKVGEVARVVEAAGGEINAWTSHDDTVYHMVLGRESTAQGLDLLADVLAHSQFDKDELAREREVVLEEIRRAQDSPARRLSMAQFELAYASHPYRDPVLGTSQSVAATTREHMLAFFHTHYRPDNTTLLVVGDVNEDAVLKDVERFFGAWKPHAQSNPKALKHQRKRRGESPREALTLKILAEDVQETHLSLAWPAPPAQDKDTAALDIFAVLLGHGESSRLHESVVRPRHLRDAYASCYTPRDQGLMFMGATLNDAKPTAAQVLEAAERLMAATQALIDSPPSERELDKARALTLADVAYSRQTMEGQARKRGFYESTCQDFAYEDSYLEAVRTLDANAVSEAAKKLFAHPPAIVLQIPQSAPADALALKAQDFTDALLRGRSLAAPKKQHRALKRQRGQHGWERIKLPSGPTLLLSHQPQGTVALKAIAPGGQRWEQRPRAGLGLLCASVWGQRTAHHDARALADKIARMGGSLSAFSGRNTLGLSGEFIVEHAQAGLALFLEALWQPVFDAEDVARESFAQKERIRARQDNPGAVASELFGATLFAHHPYGQSVLGTEATLAGLDAQALVDYHQRHTHPEDMIISVAGPMDVDALAAHLIDASQAVLARESHRVRLAGTPPHLTHDEAPQKPQVARHELNKQQSHVLVGSMGTTFKDDERFALEVLCAVLSGQSGRLFLDLRDRQSLAYSLAAGSAEGLDPGHVVVHMACAPDKVERALSGVHGHLDRLISEPVAEPELNRARNVLAGGHAIDLQRPGTRALAAATGELYGLGFESFAEAPGRVRSVTQADVQKAAEKFLHSQRRVEVVVGPA